MNDLWRIALLTIIDVAGVVLYVRARHVLRMSHSWQMLTHVTSALLGVLLGIAGGVTYGGWYAVPVGVLCTMVMIAVFAWGWLSRVALSERVDDVLAQRDSRDSQDSEM